MKGHQISSDGWELLWLLGAYPERSASTGDKSHSVETITCHYWTLCKHKMSFCEHATRLVLVLLRNSLTRRRLYVVPESSVVSKSQRNSARHGAVLDGGVNV